MSQKTQPQKPEPLLYMWESFINKVSASFFAYVLIQRFIFFSEMYNSDPLLNNIKKQFSGLSENCQWQKKS